jgi:MoxR-like ATPase
MTNTDTTLANRLLIGGPGTGKTTLFDQLAEDLDGDVRWLDGTRPLTDRLIREVYDELQERRAEGVEVPVIHLIVDDASQLDDSSVERLVRIATEGNPVGIFVNIATEQEERFEPFTEPGVARVLRIDESWADSNAVVLAA